MHSDNNSNKRQIFTVSQLNGLARQLLEGHFPSVWVEGELSNVSIPSSGHWYFTLKDDRGQVRCAMFKGSNQRSGVRPQHGMKVTIRARVSLYEGRGDYQLIADHMEDAGLGAMQRAFEELKTKLEAEGLFDQARKRPLPSQPKHIGIITSQTGAAIADMTKVLRQRCPMIPVTLIPSMVQGTSAPQSIVDAIQRAERAQLFDVLIVGRGGGSLEDLWAFNDELVARAIHQCSIPVVSAVGHEVDFSIADFVADLRAATPSQAAELVSPDQASWKRQLSVLAHRLLNSVKQNIETKTKQAEHLQKRLRHPGHQLQQQAQRIDQLEIRLINARQAMLDRYQSRLKQAELSLSKQHPQLRINNFNNQLQQLQQRYERCIKKQLSDQQLRFSKAATTLHSVSPLATLDRGYSITTTPKGEVITEASKVKSGEELEIRWHDGQRRAKII